MAAPQPSLGPPTSEKPKPVPPNLEIWVVSVLLFAGMIFSGVYAGEGRSWLFVLTCMAIFLLFLGKWICGRPLGILVSDLNVMSLSRFQTVLWTLLLLSAYLVMVMKRVHAGVANAVVIPLDSHLWMLMGISTASLVGSPLLLQNKKLEDPKATTVDKASKLLQEDPQTINNNRVGRLYSNSTPLDARFTDIFQGDLIGNTAYIDAAKLQMFFFTVVVAGAYGYQIFKAMYGAPNNLTMPDVSPGMVGLLGISHAGYLGSKTTN